MRACLSDASGPSLAARPAPRQGDSVKPVNLPNLLTLFRILLVPLAIWLIISGEFRGAFGVLVVAGATDAIDGLIAKRYNLTTELGAYLDPLADKLLLVSTYLALGARQQLPSWLVILVVSRDVMIVAAILLAVVIARPLRMRPLAISKLNTFAQICLALLVLADAGFDLRWQTLGQAARYITAMLTAASAAAYLWSWLRQISTSEGGGT